MLQTPPAMNNAAKGVKVDILEDPMGIALYAKYRAEKPELHMEDWKGLAAIRKADRLTEKLLTALIRLLSSNFFMITCTLESR